MGGTMGRVLLYSGGMDSWLIDKLWEPYVRLYIDIHGAYSDHEVARLPKDVTIADFPLLGKFEQPDMFVPLRNIYFMMIASHYGDEVCIGATRGDGSKDKSLDFLVDMDRLLGHYWDDKKVSKSVSVCMDFIGMTKGDLLRTYASRGGDLERVRAETFSCYTPRDSMECGECYPCFRKYAALHSCGLEYPEEYERRMWEFVKSNVIPTAEQGGYDGTHYTMRPSESAELIAAVEHLRRRYGQE